MRISDWSSDVCSSDLEQERQAAQGQDPDRSYPRYRSGGRADLQLRHRIARTAYREAEKAVGMSLRSTKLHRHPVADQEQKITHVTKPINDAGARSTESRLGKRGVSTCKSWWSADQ